MNKLLERQIKKYLGDINALPENFAQIFKAIDEAYESYESDIALMERAFDMSSQEFTLVNDQLQKEIDARKRTEEALRESERQLQLKLDYILSPDKKIEDFSLTDLIDINTLQEIQDSFSKTTGVASLITDINANPITKPSNFCKVCELIRSSKKGSERCGISDKLLGEKTAKLKKPVYEECTSCGFIDACAPIFVEDVHIANWFIGQINIERVDKNRIQEYAVEIGVDLDEMLDTYEHISSMDIHKFKEVLSLLWQLARNLSQLGFNNLKLARELYEREQLENEILKTRKLESIGILAGGIAHDFNNILTSILGNIMLAKEFAESNNELEVFLSNMEKASQRAQDLTHQLLTFSKGGVPVKKVASISDLVKDSVTFVLKGSNVRSNFVVQDNLYSVEIDAGQINQVINNLIINADQAMPDGGEIIVRCENVVLSENQVADLKKGAYVRISIQDQGNGIPEENISQVFDPYFSTKPNGSGLGLATSYSILKKHDGHICVESTVGKGSIFYIYLPASSGNIEQSKNSNIQVIKGKGRILVMDDDPMICTTLKQMLKHLGYEATTVSDGDQAIEAYQTAMDKNEYFDVVIMDLTIPGGMGGKEAVRKLIEINPDVKCIVSSGYSHDPVMASYEEHGFKDILRKPFNMSRLSAVMGDLTR